MEETLGFICGIVGLPNVGKSTIFNALTSSRVAVENYPFCTIDPNIGVVPVPDDRLDALVPLVGPDKVTPTTIEFLDVAGLVRGASRGEGLGNQFLGHMHRADAIVHVVRCFEDDHVTHVDGTVDPVRDLEVINTELALADLEVLERRREKLKRGAKSGDPQIKGDLEVIEGMVEALGRGNPLRDLEGERGEELCRELGLLTRKPIFYVANIDEGGDHERLAAEIAARAPEPSAEVVVICGKLEAELEDLTPAERREFLEEAGFSESGLHRLIQTGYRILDLITFYTVVGTEMRAWTLRRNSSALEAAARIHSDMARGFIKAEIIHYSDFMEAGSEAGARDAGHAHIEGRDYVMQDGDIARFRFNV